MTAKGNGMAPSGPRIQAIRRPPTHCRPEISFLRPTYERGLALVAAGSEAYGKEHLGYAVRCGTYENYRGCFPWSKFEIEELLSFAIGIVANEVIGRGRCESCSGTVIMDRLAPTRPSYAHCQRTHPERVAVDATDCANDPVSKKI